MSKSVKAVRLKNFTGTIRVNPNKTVSVVGRGKGGTRRNPDDAPNLRKGRPSEKEFYRRALKYYDDARLAESALANYRLYRERTKKR